MLGRGDKRPSVISFGHTVWNLEVPNFHGNLKLTPQSHYLLFSGPVWWELLSHPPVEPLPRLGPAVRLQAVIQADKPSPFNLPLQDHFSNDYFFWFSPFWTPQLLTSSLSLMTVEASTRACSGLPAEQNSFSIPMGSMAVSVCWRLAWFLR